MLAYLGVRNEAFTNFNNAGQVFMKQAAQWAPRLGVSWDVNGDSSLKIYANAGRYFLALPNGVAVRSAGGSLYTTQRFRFSGIDPPNACLLASRRLAHSTRRMPNTASPVTLVRPGLRI